MGQKEFKAQPTSNQEYSELQYHINQLLKDKVDMLNKYNLNQSNLQNTIKQLKQIDKQKYFQQKTEFLKNTINGKIKPLLILGGPQSSGKTQLMNTLIGQNIYPSHSGEATTQCIFHSWKKQSNEYKLFAAKFVDCSGIQIPIKQSNKPLAQGVQNIREYLQRRNYEFIKEVKSIQQTLDNFDQQISKIKYELHQLQNDRNKNNNQDKIDNEKQKKKFSKEIEQLNKKKNEFNSQNVQQTVEIYIYEGPIQKLNIFPQIIEDEFYIVDMPGFDSNNPIIEKFVQNMLKQQNSTVFTQTKVFSLICDANSLTMKHFIQQVDKIAKQNQEEIEKMKEKHRIYNYIGQNYIQNSQEDCQNYFLTVNKIDDNQKEKKLDEIIYNESGEVQTNENLKKIINNGFFKISALECFKKDTLSGNFQSLDQIIQEKGDALKYFAENQQNWKILEFICKNKQKKIIQDQEILYNDTENFKEFSQEFYEAIYNKKQQKKVVDYFQNTKDGISDFVEQIIMTVIKLHINNIKLQISEILCFENIFGDGPFSQIFKDDKININQYKCQLIIQKIDEFSNIKNLQYECITKNLKNLQEQYLSQVIQCLENLQNYVKQTKIQSCQSNEYKQYTEQVGRDLDSMAKDYIDLLNKVLYQYFNRVSILISSIKDFIPENLHDFIKFKSEMLQIESIVTLLGGVGTGFFWAVRFFQLFLLASSFTPTGTGISAIAFLGTSSFSYFVNKNNKNKSIDYFQKQLKKACIQLKKLLKHKSENNLILIKEQIKEQFLMIQILKQNFQLKQNSLQLEQAQTDVDEITQIQ
ncbi:P-loop containing nucleoside triphosphate hydrolase [Pseudocohnilembus persalinus]|uniref:p-loop containing nucleoside triphosphate hydrolase n=1 Tax=Pseudocohnilembus persalinus TaxID=266149 RepID=A0A0V0Q7N3_PSEPJ|nr:P-loop containing nucleoside triphosphate hydrolase [Pseudocohnilembus persalinus]|eukprot:KRW98258.1 P-loop containing nucleoside triphosphate hydrolase [Pseudocohnilembus persalinus]